MKKLIVVILILVAAAGGYGVYSMRKTVKDPEVTTQTFSRGDVVDSVVSTGTLQAVTTVQVGTQVSGIVDELFADFNDIVKKGQIVAKLNPDILQTQVETAKANLVNANANLERQKIAVEDAQTKLTRATELNAKSLVTKADLESAQVTVRSAQAQLRSTQSSIVQAEAAVNKAEVDLSHTIITAPIDGIVISRNVDRGQTVAASMSAPVLFIIAADLTKMQVSASVDESAVGRMRPGQNVTFRVDAYPNDSFRGTVQQVRLNPVTVQNVVTYATLIDVPNPEYKLKPGMTASPVTIEIARHNDVMRVPNAALRYRPSADIYAALNQPVPPEMTRGGGRNAGNTPAGRGGAPGGAPTGAGTTGSPAATTPGTSAPATSAAAGQNPPRQRAEAGADQGARRPRGEGGGSAAENRGGGDNAGNRPRGEGMSGGGRGGFDPNMTPEERRKRMEERLANMTPEERARFEERMKNGGGRGGSGGGQGFGGNQNAVSRGNTTGQAGRQRSAGEPAAAKSNDGAARSGGNGTIDALFAPIQIQERNQRVYLWVNKQLKSIMLRTGIADGQYTEVLNETEIQPTMEVVTNIVIPGQEPARTNTQQGNNPLMPNRQGGPGRGGPGGGGGGGGRGGR